ncbi:MAG: ACT domain-containing protein [Planctomycetota bacterium]|nr:ACT domain-containing protein [Planctomycetota bacterium]
MEKMTQLSIAMENAPGQLGRVCRALAQANVNIRGISVSDATDISTIRLLVNDVPAAKKALREAGVQFVSQEVLVLDLEDKPGALEKVASRLGEAGVNVHYVYGTGESGQKGVMVLRVSDVDRARQALGR